MVTLAVKNEGLSFVKSKGLADGSGEAVAFCPRCKAIQTVWISDNMLMPTRKFIQDGTEIYHDCGSNEPCRLFHTW